MTPVRSALFGVTITARRKTAVVKQPPAPNAKTVVLTASSPGVTLTFDLSKR